MAGRHVLIAAAADVVGLVSQAQAQDKTNFLMSQCAAGNAAACNALREPPSPQRSVDPALRALMQGRCMGNDMQACAVLYGTPPPQPPPPSYSCFQYGRFMDCEPR